LKTIALVKLDTGYYTWKGNEEGFSPHSTCIIAVKTGRPIAAVVDWLVRHKLYTQERQDAIFRLDDRSGVQTDVPVIRKLAKNMKMKIKT
jgi:hypothetical protein